MDELELFKRLGVALAAGMLIGLERGWHERAMPEGSRVAGIRTFAIIGLLGGLWALLGELVGEIALGFAFLAFAVVMIIARVRATAKIDDYGITTVVAALVTFALDQQVEGVRAIPDDEQQDQLEARILREAENASKR